MLEIELLTNVSNDDGAEATYQRVVKRLQQAKDNVLIHMFVWRADAAGQRIASAVLQAAQQGVDIHIIKDKDALMYETIEMNRTPLFQYALSFRHRLQYKILSWFMPNTAIKNNVDHGLAKQILAMPNVKFDWVTHTHHKYYIIDNTYLITGSINIEDRHHQYWDYMIELKGAEIISRFNARLQQLTVVDTTRHIDFVINDNKSFEIKPFILSLLASVKATIYIEMAYIGDEDITLAIIAAAQRGVEVTVLFSRLANVGNDINYQTLYRIAKACSIKVFIANKMIHSKMMIFDNQKVLLGSANLSIYSMQKGKELSVFIQNEPEFIEGLLQEVKRRMDLSEFCTDIKKLQCFNVSLAYLQQLHQKRQ